MPVQVLNDVLQKCPSVALHPSYMAKYQVCYRLVSISSAVSCVASKVQVPINVVGCQLPMGGLHIQPSVAW